MINFLLLILIFVLSFLIANKWYINIQSDKYKKKNNLKFKRESIFLKNFFSKYNFIKTKENFLLKQGFPLKLNAVKYYILKITLCLVLLFAGLYNYQNTLLATILAIFGFSIIDIFIMIHKKDRDDEICIDLLNVTDSICLQLSAHVHLKDALKKQYENCKNKDFKKAMIEFITKYELSELNIETAILSLKEKFDVLEVNMFCASLMEYNKTENVSEILENLYRILETKYIDKLKKTTQTKTLTITFGVIIALGNIVMLTFYPLFISIGQGFNKIFS